MTRLTSKFDELIEHQVERALSNALAIVRDIFTTHTLPPRQRPPTSRMTLRYRSASHHRPERKLPFYHTVPRCSLPSTKNDLIYLQSRVSSSAAKWPRHRTNGDVQYSFSLHKSWSNEINYQPIRQLADELSAQTIRSALKQIDDQPVLTTFVHRWLDQTVERAMDTIFRLTIEQFLDHFLEEIFTDALSIVAENELSTQSLLRLRPQPTDPMEHFVEQIAERIFVQSFDSLRETFVNEQQSNSTD